MSDRATFFFANLGADVIRSALAAEAENEKEYRASLDRAYKTLRYLAKEKRPEALEEGLLLVRALEHARASHTLTLFRRQTNELIAPVLAALGSA